MNKFVTMDEWDISDALNRNQGTHEPVDDYVAALTKLRCRIEMSEEEMQRHLIKGLRPELKKMVSIGDNDTLAEKVSGQKC